MKSDRHAGKTVLVISGLLACGFLLGGAGPARSAPAPLKVTMSGYSVGGASSIVGEAIGDAIKRTVPGSAFTYEPGQSGANEVMVATGKTELGLSHVWTTKAAIEGKEFYKQAYPNLRVIAYLHDTQLIWLFRKDAGITAIEQIKAKKFPLVAGVNTKNSVMEMLPRKGLEAYGVTYDDVGKWGGKLHYLSTNPSFDMMKNKQANAFLGSITPPYKAITELSTSIDLILLPMTDQAIDQVAKAMGGGVKSIIPKGTYPFVTADVPTVAVPNVLITRAEVPEEQVYWITKAIYDNLDHLHKVSKQLDLMTKQTIATQVGALPLHPGAKKLYQEVGILK